MYNLFLDDERFPKNVKWIELPLVEWVIVRSYKEFINCINNNGCPKIVSFDMDLADIHYSVDWEGAMRDGQFERLNANLKEKTGYDCAKFLINYCFKYELPFPEYYVHSMNPIGREAIIQVVESSKKYLKD